MNDNDERSGILYLLAGIGLGTLIGATLGLLFAPKPGSELRHDIADKYGELSDKVKELSHQVKARGEDAVRSVRGRLGRGEETSEEAS